MDRTIFKLYIYFVHWTLFDLNPLEFGNFISFNQGYNGKKPQALVFDYLDGEVEETIHFPFHFKSAGI